MVFKQYYTIFLTTHLFVGVLITYAGITGAPQEKQKQKKDPECNKHFLPLNMDHLNASIKADFLHSLRFPPSISSSFPLHALSAVVPF